MSRLCSLTPGKACLGFIGAVVP